MGKGKNKGRQQFNNRQPGMPNGASNTLSSPKNTATSTPKAITKTVSVEDITEFERLKAARDEAGGFNIDEYRKIMQEVIDSEIEAAKQVSLDEIKCLQEQQIKDLKAKDEDYRKVWEDKNKSLLDYNAEMVVQRDELITEIEAAEKRKVSLQTEIEKQIETAFKDERTALKKRETELNDLKISLDKSSQAMEEKEEDLNLQKEALERQKSRLARKEEIYMTANPEELQFLKNELTQKHEYIDELLNNCRDLQRKIDSEMLSKIKVGDKSPSDLIREIDHLNKKIEELSNKCNKFDSLPIIEMQKALDEKPNLEKEKERLANIIRDNNAELMRFQNADRELENIKAQADLIRTLNENLKQELKTAKQTLESRVGEVCPNLTNVDIRESDSESLAIYDERKKLENESKKHTLVSIVNHVKGFAAGRTVPLYYKDSDLRAFLAGLASSHMAILQGLSGTGKTSLPDVFTDALFAENKVVSVESSWRDRNELLGYYNDFSNKFTAKDFTCYLYRAGISNYSNTPYFIVLDEMNLSRVEYYFADFLSVLERNKDEWKVSLVDRDLRSLPSELSKEVIDELNASADAKTKEIISNLYEHGKITTQVIEEADKRKLIAYLEKKGKSNPLHISDLIGGPKNLLYGNTLKIPENVWFIGTANRDESTFEITDKVYDRAQVLNFTERAEEDKSVKKVSNRAYVPYSRLVELFAEAKKTFPFDYANNPIIKEVDTYLESAFKISFGNRIGKQINDFVSVYKAAGDGEKNLAELETEAIDYQLANKVLRKLEHRDTTKVEKFEYLLELFQNYKLKLCQKIIEEKINNEG